MLDKSIDTKQDTVGELSAAWGRVDLSQQQAEAYYADVCVNHVGKLEFYSKGQTRSPRRVLCITVPSYKLCLGKY